MIDQFTDQELAEKFREARKFDLPTSSHVAEVRESLAFEGSQDAHILFCKFNNGSYYAYDVGAEVIADLEEKSQEGGFSIGMWIHSALRNAQVPCRSFDVEEEEEEESAPAPPARRKRG